MLNLIKMRLNIFKNRIFNSYKKKDLLLMSFLFIAIYTFIVIGINKGIKYLNIDNQFIKGLNLVIIINVFLLMITSNPFKIYKEYFKNKKFEILFLSPINLITCFSYQLILPLIKLIGVSSFIASPFLLVLKLRYGFSFIGYILHLSIYLTYIYIISTIIVFLIYLAVKIDKLKKVLLGIVSMIEIFYFFLIMYIFSKNSIMDIIVNLADNRYMYILNYFNSNMLSSNINAITLILNMFVIIILFSISYYLFKYLYYKKGFFGCESKNTIKNGSRCFILNKYYFFKKDLNLICRNIERSKFLLVTLIIFIINIFNDREDYSNIFVQVLLQLMIIAFVIQLCFENIFIEKEKRDYLSLSGISSYEFYKQKSIYTIIISLILINIFNILIVIVFKLDIMMGLKNLLYIFFFVVVLSKICTSLGVIMFRIKKYRIKEVLVTFLYCILAVITYVIEVSQIAVISVLIADKKIEVIATIMCILINCFLIETIIKRILKKKDFL